MAQTAESIEAVLLSGPRRGEMIRSPEAAVAAISDEAITRLSDALDRLLAAVEEGSTEVRATLEV